MRKDIVIVLFIALFIAVIVSGTKIQSVDEYYLTHIDDITEDSETIFISIDASTLRDHWDQLDSELQSEEYVPDDGVILEESEYVLRPKDTVLDVLKRAVRHHHIHMESQGADKNVYNSVYIQGINHLYEFSAGPLSGWMYAVNGESPDKGVGKYELQDGDVIEFKYTIDLGRDIGFSFEGGDTYE